MKKKFLNPEYIVQKILNKDYIGILAGAAYALIYRLLDGLSHSGWFFNIDVSVNSFTFFIFIPAVVGLLPILIAKNEIGRSWSKYFFYPIVSNIIFIIVAFSIKLEDLGCGIIILPVFILISGLIGLIAGAILKRNYKKNNTLYSLLFLPIFTTIVESNIPTPSKSYEVVSSVIIDNSKENIWSNIIEVPEIKPSEYSPDFYSFIGIPQPIQSKLEIINSKEFRIGYFTDGLTLVESIAEIERYKKVRFNIHIDQSELRDTPMDQHVLKSTYFKFTSISYHLKETVDGKTELSLKCNYTIDSKIHLYANFWADNIIRNFEEKLLAILKEKLKKK